MEGVKPKREMSYMTILPECAKCSVKAPERACRNPAGTGPAFCPTREMAGEVEEALEKYRDPEIREFARQASIQEAECYANRDRKPYVRHPVKPRLQEICEFARKMGYRKLGIAFCAGLSSEASRLQKVLENHGFEVASVICKVGCTPKEEIGITDEEKCRIGQYESMCSPIGQAEVLNQAGTEFNILLGLCVGHDSLFFKYARAMTTVFAAKDRVLGHNPLAALYTLNSYYERLSKDQE
jgi:uncharacterized metal-binding protein